jgi:hypothetical protein
MPKIKQGPATVEFVKGTVKKDPEGCKCVGSEALMELEGNCAGVSAVSAG